MKRRFFILIVCIIAVLAVFFIYYSITPYEEEVTDTPPKDENQANETITPWKFPRIIFPWTPKKTGGGAGSGGSAGSSVSGGSGGGGEIKIKPLINYTLYVDSIPNNLTILVNYTIDRTAHDIMGPAPYSLKIDEDSKACVLVEHPGTSGILEWKLDGEECIVKECYTPWSGCEVFMNSDHTVVVRWYST